METNSRPEATASPVKQGQYSPRKRKDTTPKVNPQLAVELVYQELKRVEAYTKRIENAMEKGSQLEMSIEELIKTLKEESKKREEYYILKRGILLTQILLLGLYDSYDDGIPIKFLINKGRLDFSKIMYESTEKNETNNIK